MTTPTTLRSMLHMRHPHALKKHAQHLVLLLALAPHLASAVEVHDDRPASPASATLAPSNEDPNRAAALAETQLVDRVVALVNDAPVTYCELVAEVWLEAVRQNTDTALTRPVMTAETTEAALTQAVLKTLVVQEAGDLQLFAVDPAAIDDAFTSFLRQFTSRDAFTAFLRESRMTAAQVRDRIARDLRVEKFLSTRLLVKERISDAQLRRAWESRPDLAQQSFDSVRDLLAATILRERTERLRAEWFERARERASISTFVERLAPGPLCAP